MAARQRAVAAYAWLWTVLLLPARVVEESLHALAALPFAEALVVRLTPRGGGVETAIQYPESTPSWVIRLAHVAPAAMATLAAVAMVAWWIIGGGTVWWPNSGLDWVLLWWVGVQYVAIALPEQGGVPDDRGQSTATPWLTIAIAFAVAVAVASVVPRLNALLPPRPPLQLAADSVHTVGDPSASFVLLGVGVAALMMTVGARWLISEVRRRDS